MQDTFDIPTLGEDKKDSKSVILSTPLFFAFIDCVCFCAVGCGGFFKQLQ
jgi:hypothetical protein